MPDRDPNRIRPLLDLLEEYWSRYPNLRLGQIVSIAAEHIDPFYVEDRDVFVFLERKMSKNKETL